MGIIAKTVSIAATAFLAAGCASAPHYPAGHEASAGQLVKPHNEQEFSIARKATGISHASWVYARSVYENPINRPVSHFATLGSLALKSTGGMLRRVVIGTAQMPSLSDDIPAVANAEPMNTEAFEDLLDRITGTRNDTGRIKFLVDGDEYFGRLMETIESAEKSVDIRTYIFDNDDFAVAMADYLKERSAEVRVRVMLDSIGNMLAVQADPDSLPADHEHPLSMHLYMESRSDVKVRNMTNPWTTGDHDWHDLMMEVSGPVVDQLQFESDKAWARGGLFGDLANAVRFLRGKKNNADREGYPVRSDSECAEPHYYRERLFL
jgi:hypothetical protein